jgi:hypothetical protein
MTVRLSFETETVAPEEEVAEGEEVDEAVTGSPE